jgi:hypothetical protein
MSKRNRPACHGTSKLSQKRCQIETFAELTSVRKEIKIRIRQQNHHFGSKQMSTSGHFLVPSKNKLSLLSWVDFETHMRT